MPAWPHGNRGPGSASPTEGEHEMPQLMSRVEAPQRVDASHDWAADQATYGWTSARPSLPEAGDLVMTAGRQATVMAQGASRRPAAPRSSRQSALLARKVLSPPRLGGAGQRALRDHHISP
jgi:hypothetical protein